MAILDHVSLISGSVPWLIGAGGFAALAATIARWPRRAWWALPLVLVGAGAMLAAVSSWLRLPDKLHGTWPRSFFLWCAFPLLALVVGLITWRRSRWRHRVAALLAVLLLASFAADRVDAFYGAIPTVGDLVGARLPGQVSGVLASPYRDGRMPATGVVTSFRFPPDHSRFHARAGYVWLPPIWFSRPRPRLPVLELLNGAPGTPEMWLRGGRAVQTLDDYARAHHGWGPIAVVADENSSLFGDTECVDGPRGNAETYVTVDVVHSVETRFDALSVPRSWAIAGYSSGGTCALVLALRHPGLYGAFGDYSGDPRPHIGPWSASIDHLYGGSVANARQHEPAYLLARHWYRHLVGWLECGLGDSPLRVTAMREYAALARRRGAHIVLDTPPGTHSFYIWSEALRRSLPDLVRSIGDHRYPARAV